MNDPEQNYSNKASHILLHYHTILIFILIKLSFNFKVCPCI